MTKVYIAGPVTGTDDYKIRFSEAEAQIRELGLEPVNPVAPGLVEGASYKYYIDRGLKMLMESDVVLMLPGWTQSDGARLEEMYARICGIPVVEKA
jgi:hypothetical protein